MSAGHHSKLLENFTHKAASWTGSPLAFLTIGGLTLLWALSGPFFNFSTSWQLLMNTISSAITFVMVFLLQRSQNKDTLAMQMKLNEIIGALRGASNHLINVEEMGESEMQMLRESYRDLAAQIHSGEEHSTHAVSIKDIEAP